jgi:RNA polymerase sigma-70 factor, ECF subfamily
MNDLELVTDILHGNINSFNTIIYKYESSVFRFIYSMVKDTETSRDLTQEVFITVYNKLYTYRGQSKFSNWLYQIARNKSLDYVRKNNRLIRLGIEEAWNIGSKDILPEQWLELKETKGQLKRFIQSLDDIDRQILILKGLNVGMKFNDIADVLNTNVSTVKTKYYRLWDKYNSFLNKEEKRCDK